MNASQLQSGGKEPEAIESYRRALDLFDADVAAAPRDLAARFNLVVTCQNLGSLLAGTDALVQAEKLLRRAVDEALKLQEDFPNPGSTVCANAQNELARFLLNKPRLPTASAREPIELAKQALSRRSNEANLWNTLGAAHYRANEWSESFVALQKAVSLRSGDNSFDCFYLAMAHYQLGHKAEGRLWLDKAINALPQTFQSQTIPGQPPIPMSSRQRSELDRLRVEAEKLINEGRP